MGVVPPITLWQPWEAPTSTLLNARIRDAIQFLKSVPMCVLRRTSTQAIGSDSWTAVDWQNEDLDSDNGHDPFAVTTRYVAKTAGFYLLVGTVGWQNAATKYRKICFRKNGQDTLKYGEHTLNVHEANTIIHHLTTSAYVYLEVNDYIELMVNQDSGVTLNLTVDSSDPRLEIRWVGLTNTEKFPIPPSFTWVPGLVSTADLNVNMRDVYAGLLQPIMATYSIRSAKQGSTNSFPPFIYPRLVTWDSIEYDSHDALGDNLFTAPVSGWYNVVLTLVIEDAGRPAGLNNGTTRYWGVMRNPPKGTSTDSLITALYDLFFSYPEQDNTNPARTDSYTLFGDLQMNAGDTLGVVTDPWLDDPQIVPGCRWDIRWVSNL